MLLDITHEAMVVLVAQYMVMQFTLLHEISNPSQWSCEKNSQKMHFLMQQKQASLHLLVFLLASMRKGQLTDIHMQLAFFKPPKLAKKQLHSCKYQDIVVGIISFVLKTNKNSILWNKLDIFIQINSYFSLLAKIHPLHTLEIIWSE